MSHEGFAQHTEHDHLQPYAVAMDKYRYAIEPIEWQLRADKPANEVAGYLGTGARKHAFKFEGPDSSVVVKYFHGIIPRQGRGTERLYLPHDEYLDEDTRYDVAPLVAAKDMPGTAHEQLLALDSWKGVFISTLGEGLGIAKATPADIRAITDEQLVGLDTTRRRFRDYDIHPHNIEGVLLGKEKGFNFVDYTIASGEGGVEELDPSHSTATFLENVLDDIYARARQQTPNPERMAARTEVLSRLGRLGIK